MKEALNGFYVLVKEMFTETTLANKSCNSAQQSESHKFIKIMGKRCPGVYYNCCTPCYINMLNGLFPPSILFCCRYDCEY